MGPADCNYYYCSSSDLSGNETKSGKIYIQIRDMEPPSAPIGLTTSTEPGFITLKWQPNSEKMTLRKQMQIM